MKIIFYIEFRTFFCAVPVLPLLGALNHLLKSDAIVSSQQHSDSIHNLFSTENAEPAILSGRVHPLKFNLPTVAR